MLAWTSIGLLRQVYCLLVQGFRPTMKRRKNKRGRPFKCRAPLQTPPPRTIEMEPEELAVYVRRAEQEVLPIIKELKLNAGAAQFLLAQYTRVLITGDERLTLESAMAIGNAVLALWQAGYYTPSSQYPYSLAETLEELEEGPKAEGDYADAFLPFTPVETVPPRTYPETGGDVVD